MKVYKLEKDITLFKVQFDNYCLNLFQEYRLDRLSLDVDGLLFKIKYMVKHNKDIDKVSELQNQFTEKAKQLHNSFGEFLYTLIAQVVGIPEPFKLDDLEDVLAHDVKIDNTYVKFKMVIISKNKEFLEYIDNSIPEGKTYNIDPNEYFRFYTDSYNDGISKAYPELFENRHQDVVGKGADGDVFVHNFTFQTSERCSLNCTYCLSGDSEITMADRSKKRIKDIKVGDMILGCSEDIIKINDNEKFYNETNFKPSKVTHIFKREAETINVEWKSCGEEFRVTKDHPFLSTNREWMSFYEIMNSKNPSDGFVLCNEEGYVTSVNTYELELGDTRIETVYNLETECHTFIVSDLVCHNCYQYNKTPMRMSFETAKTFIDNLLDDKYGYINRYNSPAIIIEFIGGEPLMEIKLTRKIYEYFLERCYELNHPWFNLHRVSICSNGLQYFDIEVQDFFKEYAHNISFNISIDGNKELHDACRIQPNGEGSYDIDMAALNHYNKHYTPERNSKMTLAPSNIKYLFDSVVNFIENGMTCININCVFEEGWNQETALIEYQQLKKLADYLLDNDLEHLYIAIFNERQEDMFSKYNDSTACFKAGTIVSTPNGATRIESINIGDKIYTASGSIHKVSNMYKYESNDNKILNITGAFPIHCTSDHKVFAKKFLYRGWKGKIHYSEPGFYPVSELKKGDRIALPILDFSNNKQNWIDKKIAYAIGVYIADGYINRNNVVITPGYDEDKYYYNILKQAGFVITDDKTRTSMRYIINRSASPNNERFFKVCESCGRGAYNKHFPPIAFHCHEYIIREIMRGYEDTDGSVTKDGMVKVNTVSPHLANDYLLLLRSIGEYPICYLNKRDGTTMVIEGRTVNVRDRYEIYYNPYKRDKHFMFKHDPDISIIWSQLRSIEDDEDSYTVYCPTVVPFEDNFEEHTFIANGVAVSNCGGSGSMLSLRPNGQFYPCIRYMPTSVGNHVKDLCIGNIEDGIIGREQDSEVLKMMDRITRRSYSNDICYECPLSNDCGLCFRAGTLIETINGPVPIEEIKVGDMVLTQSGEYHRVINKFSRYASSEDTYSVKAIGTPMIYTTKDHPFWVKKAELYQNGRIKGYKDPQWVEAKDISRNDKVFMLYKKFGDISVDSGIAYMVGRWLGDGWRTDETSHNGKIYSRFLICCGHHEYEFMREILDSTGIDYSYKDHNNTSDIFLIKSNTINEKNKILISILKKCGKYAHGKFIPEEIYNWDKDSIAMLLSGYLGADGSREKRKGLIRSATVSKKLAYGISNIYRIIGKNPSWSISYNQNNIIEGRVVNSKPIYDIRTFISSKQSKTLIDHKLHEMWASIRMSKPQGLSYMVYNIEVECDHSYYADGVLVHNCIALGHSTYGTPNKRTTFNCIQMIAESLANVYYWNRLLLKHPKYDLPVRKNVVPDEWALLIIDKEELDNLKLLECMAIINKIDNN